LSAALADSGYQPADLFGLQGSIATIPGVEEPERIEALLADASTATIAASDLEQRGIWTLTQADAGYPARLSETLAIDAPPVLFGVGDAGLLHHPGIGIVGSRNISEAGGAAAQTLAAEAVRLGYSVVSGGARGTDQFSMNAAVSGGGNVVGVLADALTDRIRKSDVLAALDGGSTCLITQQTPSSGASPGAAMGRNKIIYGLTEATAIVASALESGDTWAGAIEALNRDLTRVVVWRGEGEGDGNAALVARGAMELSDITRLEDILKSESKLGNQTSLFD
jgi:predicted Rossmann fold nucleotide-binding protein DprA/Smf involved in DNA uptake